MSGLDSIALAVAHLEERHNKKSADTNSTSSSLNSSSIDNDIIIMNMAMNAASTKVSTNHSEASVTASVIPNRFANNASPSMNVPSAPIMAASVRSLASFPPPPPPPPPPRALHAPPARVVSMDEPSLTSPSTTKSITAAVPSPNNHSNGSTFGYILADPIKWLQKTQDRPPLQPPSDLVLKVQPTDVLCGRGGETNHHLGNVQYRLLVKTFQPLYVSAKRRDKPLIAQCIVYSVRQVGGRFLKRANDKEWKDVGNTKAREKTSQALREGAPELRGGSVPKMVPKQKMVLPAAPPRLPPTAATAPGQAMSFVEARFISALLAQQAALTRSVVANQQHQQPPPTAGMPSHPIAPPAVATTAILPQPTEQQLQQQHYDHSQGAQLYPPFPPPPQQQMLQLPLPEVPTQPSAVSTTRTENNARKRPAVVSDGHSDSDSIGSISSSSGNGGSRSTVGPRLKRFKMRFQQESSSSGSA